MPRGVYKRKKGLKRSPCPIEVRDKIRIAQIGRPKSLEMRKRYSETHKRLYKEGKNLPPSQVGIKRSEEFKKRVGDNSRGEKNHAWKGGISFEPYSVDWTKTLRRSIRERDYYTCQVCKEPQEDKALDIHHIDYNKKNCSSENLIALCRACHVGTNHNREYWKKYFQIQRCRNLRQVFN